MSDFNNLGDQPSPPPYSPYEEGFQTVTPSRSPKWKLIGPITVAGCVTVVAIVVISIVLTQTPNDNGGVTTTAHPSTRECQK